jgi:hypothetical protein
VSPVKYELDFYIPEDGIHHSHRRENLNKQKQTPWPLVCERAIQTERPPLVDEI